MAKSPGDIDTIKLPPELLQKVCPLYIPTILGKHGDSLDCNGY